MSMYEVSYAHDMSLRQPIHSVAMEITRLEMDIFL